MKARPTRAVPWLGAIALAACAAGISLDPPAIRYGEEECAVCGMIISDQRFAAAVVETDQDGRARKPAFDDVGCLLEHEKSGAAGRTILARWVRDFSADRWLDLDAATFVHSGRLHSPMAFGVAACADAAAAEALLRTYTGETLDARVLRSRHAAGELVIGSSPGGSQP